MVDSFLLKIKSVFGANETSETLNKDENIEATKDSSEQIISSDNQKNNVSEKNAIDQYNLGLMYANGEGVKQDYFKAVEWIQKAAEQGNAEAQNKLGFMYEKGQGVEQDYIKAVEWYQRAAEQGHAEAQFNLDRLSK